MALVILDKLMNGWWMHGLTSVVAAIWEGIRPSQWFTDKEQIFTLRYAFMICSLHVYDMFDEIPSMFWYV